jgi:hypothetical protein
MPLAAIIPIAVGALLLVLVFALGRRPNGRTTPLRASAVEAGERTSDLAAEFFEWLRTGR